MSKIEYLGKMPDPFRRPDGTRMTAEKWYENRAALRDFVVDMEFGGMPPRPEVVRFDRLSGGAKIQRGGTAIIYKVTAGTKERQLSFLLELYIPYVPGKAESAYAPFAEDEKYPVLMTGDGCYLTLESDTIAEARKRGYIVARFNRLEFAADVPGVRTGGLYDIYPDYPDFTAISAWAWGYMTCMDVFEQLSFVDVNEVGITGHSRGGKTVMLAAVMDERIKYTCPNNSGCHGAVSHRCSVTEQGEKKKRSERLGDMLVAFPHWMGLKLTPYAGREQDLPYDMHYFGALIAPRYYLQCEGLQDYWINPVGAWQNLCAVKACYRRLGCEDHAAGWFRPGEHRHELPDFTEFMNFMDRARAGLPLAEHLTINPFPTVELNFDWGREDV